MTVPQDDPLGIPRRRSPNVTPEDRTAMAVAHEYGVSQTDLAQLFGYNPRTVRKALRDMDDEERRLVGIIASQELAGLHTALGRKALLELLGRDLGRKHRDSEGNEVEGSYQVTDTVLLKMASSAAEKLTALAPAAAMARQKDEAPLNPVAGFLRNQEELARVTRQLPVGVRLKLDVRQSLEVSGSGSDASVASSGAADADFSVEDESEDSGGE